MLTGLGIDEYFQRADSSGTLSYLADMLGSTMALADASGAASHDVSLKKVQELNGASPPVVNVSMALARGGFTVPGRGSDAARA